MPRMQANSVYIGTNGNYYFIDWDVVGQNEDGNYSTINWNAYFHYAGSDAQLDNGYAHLAGAHRWSNGGRVRNYQGIFAHRDVHLAGGSFNVGHDGNGNLTIHVAGGVTPYQSARSEAGANYGIPGLYQAIAYHDIQIVNVTDVSYQVYCHVNRTANNLWLSINGSGWQHYHSGNFGSLTVQVGSQANPVKSGSVHSVALKVSRASNGWQTDSGTYYLTTVTQNKFFDIGKA